MTKADEPAFPAPGRELDQLIAEKVFGAKVTWAPFGGMADEQYRSATGGLSVRSLLRYSTSIEAAWLVVEKLKNEDMFVEIFAPRGELHWVCRFYHFSKAELGDSIVGGGADTAPHAICLAALKAVGHPSR